MPPIARRGRLQLHRSALVFFGENSGSFVAVDADNGKVLWEFTANQTWRP